MLGCEQTSIEEELEDQIVAPPEPAHPETLLYFIAYPVFEEGERVHSIDNVTGFPS